MTPEFSNLVNPTIKYVLDLVEQIRGGRDVDFKSEHSRLRRLLEAAEREAAEIPGLSEEEFVVTQRALVHWVDEVLTQADPNWENHTLEWDYFQSRDRAWHFYLDGERRALACSADVIEVYYLAMVLGFEGDIFEAFRRLGEPIPGDQSEEEARRRWAEKLAREIPKRRGDPGPSRPVFEGDIRALSGAEALKASLGWLGAMLLFLLLLVAGYFLAQR
jgi:type VI protein secretion system component VasF